MEKPGRRFAGLAEAAEESEEMERLLDLEEREEVDAEAEEVDGEKEGFAANSGVLVDDEVGAAEGRGHGGGSGRVKEVEGDGRALLLQVRGPRDVGVREAVVLDGPRRRAPRSAASQAQAA
ncbi:hypothetical protein VE04_09175 [Pseudogymnoascus sp. 24MN13]|nr:hypothetical protein VE04_09175 [Pseudogymnoascus sp. 24MN13]